MSTARPSRLDIFGCCGTESLIALGIADPTTTTWSWTKDAGILRLLSLILFASSYKQLNQVPDSVLGELGKEERCSKLFKNLTPYLVNNSKNKWNNVDEKENTFWVKLFWTFLARAAAYKRHCSVSSFEIVLICVASNGNIFSDIYFFARAELTRGTIYYVHLKWGCLCCV